MVFFKLQNCSSPVMQKTMGWMAVRQHFLKYLKVEFYDVQKYPSIGRIYLISEHILGRKLVWYKSLTYEILINYLYLYLLATDTLTDLRIESEVGLIYRAEQESQFSHVNKPYYMFLPLRGW